VRGGQTYKDTVVTEKDRYGWRMERSGQDQTQALALEQRTTERNSRSGKRSERSVSISLRRRRRRRQRRVNRNVRVAVFWRRHTPTMYYRAPFIKLAVMSLCREFKVTRCGIAVQGLERVCFISRVCVKSTHQYCVMYTKILQIFFPR